MRTEELHHISGSPPAPIGGGRSTSDCALSTSLVLGLHVAVHHPTLVRVPQCVRNLAHDTDCLRYAEGVLGIEAITQGPTFHHGMTKYSRPSVPPES